MTLFCRRASLHSTKMFGPKNCMNSLKQPSGWVCCGGGLNVVIQQYCDFQVFMLPMSYNTVTNTLQATTISHSWYNLCGDSLAFSFTGTYTVIKSAKFRVVHILALAVSHTYLCNMGTYASPVTWWTWLCSRSKAAACEEHPRVDLAIQQPIRTVHCMHCTDDKPSFYHDVEAVT